MAKNNMLIPQETNALFPTLFLVLLPFLFLVVKHLKSIFSKSPPIPPGPKPWPILGNICQLGPDEPLHLAFTRFSKIYGPDLFSLKLGAQLVVVGSTRAAAAEIMKTHDRNLSARSVPDLIRSKTPPELNNLSLGWAHQCDDRWKRLRTTCRMELFSNKALQSQASLRGEKVNEVVEIIRKMEGKDVKFKNVAFATMINIISHILLSRGLPNLEDEILNGDLAKVFRSGLELLAAPNISDMYPILSPLDLQSLRKKFMEVYRGSCCKLWDQIVKERKLEKTSTTQNDSRGDFLDALIRDGASQEQINVILTELFVAGTDTSGTTIEWAMAELVKNPRCMKIVKEELAREIGNQVVTELDLPKLKYLEACVKEALRLHPPAPIPIPRRAAESCQVMNYTIPKNTQIMVNVWAIGRDPNSWEDPLVFKPERFLNSSLDFRGTDFEFLPFGGGRRICPGMPMAAKHVPLIIASFIQSFDWYLPGGMDPKDLDMSEKYNFHLRKKEPLVLVPKARLIIN